MSPLRSVREIYRNGPRGRLGLLAYELDEHPVDPELPPRWVRVGITLALAASLLGGALLMFVLVVRSGELPALIRRHGAAFIGIPWSGGASFSVVLVLPKSFGSMKFRVLVSTDLGQAVTGVHAPDTCRVEVTPGSRRGTRRRTWDIHALEYGVDLCGVYVSRAAPHGLRSKSC